MRENTKYIILSFFWWPSSLNKVRERTLHYFHRSLIRTTDQSSCKNRSWLDCLAVLPWADICGGTGAWFKPIGQQNWKTQQPNARTCLVEVKHTFWLQPLNWLESDWNTKSLVTQSRTSGDCSAQISVLNNSRPMQWVLAMPATVLLRSVDCYRAGGKPWHQHAQSAQHQKIPTDFPQDSKQKHWDQRELLWTCLKKRYPDISNNNLPFSKGT